MEIKELDENIYKKIMMSAELFFKKEKDRNVFIVDALDWLRDITENEDLNKVSDIHIYEEGFGKSEDGLKATTLHMITSIIAEDYKDENFQYLESLILSEDGFKSDLAFDYYVKIGGYKTKFRDHILSFVEENIYDLTKNKLNAVAFYMMKIYGKNERHQKLFTLAHSLHEQKYPSPVAEKKASSDILQNITVKKTKAWWKFW